MEEVNLKIIPDIPCEVYVDYEFITVANKGTMTKIPLCRGEYAIRLVSTVNSNYYIEDVIVLEYDKVWKADFCTLIERHPELRKDVELQINDDRIYDCLLCREIYIKEKYDYIDNYFNHLGWIRVKRNDKWGYISLKGNQVIPCIYEEEPHNVGSGLFSVKYNDKYGCIDKTGTEVIPCICDWISTYSDGVIKAKRSNKIVFFDTLGNEVLALKDGDWADDFNEGLAAYSKYGNVYGFIDKTGTEVISCKYKIVRHFREGLAAVMNKFNEWGFIDKTGTEVIPCKYIYVDDFEKGIAHINCGGPESFRFVNKVGEEFFKLKWTHKIEQSICDGYKVFYDNNIINKCGYYNANGVEIIPCIYQNIIYVGELFICYGDNYSDCEFVDKHGQTIIPFGKYDAGFCSNFFVRVRRKDNQKWGCLNSLGEESIPCEYEKIIEFEGGILWLNKNNQWECKIKNDKTLKINVFDGLETYCAGYKSSAVAIVNTSVNHLYLDKYGNLL